MQMKNVAIIPARMDSTRFPGKPMEKIFEKPMIGHVYYRTKLAKGANLVCVATCDKIIYDYIVGIGGCAIMTSSTHERATDRASEALAKIEKINNINYENVAMIQGDEPLLNPNDINMAFCELENNKALNIVNLMSDINTSNDFFDKNIVKVVTDIHGDALYFSREPIPHKADEISRNAQTGLIFFKRDYLIHYNSMVQTPLEIIESIDMMRVIENGDSVRMLKITGNNIGVDTKEDLLTAKRLMESDMFLKQYLN